MPFSLPPPLPSPLPSGHDITLWPRFCGKYAFAPAVSAFPGTLRLLPIGAGLPPVSWLELLSLYLHRGGPPPVAPPTDPAHRRGLRGHDDDT